MVRPLERVFVLGHKGPGRRRISNVVVGRPCPTGGGTIAVDGAQDGIGRKGLTERNVWGYREPEAAETI